MKVEIRVLIRTMVYMVGLLWFYTSSKAESHFEHIQFTVIASGDLSDNSPMQAGFRSIKTRQELGKFLKPYLASEEPWHTEYDFDSGVVIVLNAGRKTHGPYDLGVVHLVGLNGLALLKYIIVSPGEGCIVTWNITHQYRLLYVHAKINELEAQEIITKGNACS